MIHDPTALCHHVTMSFDPTSFMAHKEGVWDVHVGEETDDDLFGPEIDTERYGQFWPVVRQIISGTWTFITFRQHVMGVCIYMVFGCICTIFGYVWTQLISLISVKFLKNICSYRIFRIFHI